MTSFRISAVLLYFYLHITFCFLTSNIFLQLPQYVLPSVLYSNIPQYSDTVGGLTFSLFVVRGDGVVY